MQRVVNISLGSVLSTISLTIPVVLLVGLIARREVSLGVTPIQGIMLAFTLLIGMNSYRTGDTNVLQGIIHFALFAAFVALIFLGSA
jgi:Ca2+:H+ antiporter